MLKIKTAMIIAGFGPFAYLGFRFFAGGLGVNPVETMIRFTGDWILHFLWLTLLFPVAGRLFRVFQIAGGRRIVGLFTFFYATLHLLLFLVFEHSLNLESIVRDVVKRPFITLGFFCFLLLFLLAITSSNRMMRRMGKNWKRLHRGVYVILAGGLIHFALMIKADYDKPIIYAAFFASLLILKWVLNISDRRAQQALIRSNSRR